MPRWIRPAAEAGRNWTPMASCAAGCSFIWATTPLLPLRASARCGNLAPAARLLWSDVRRGPCVYGQALEPREFTVAGAQPVFGEAGAGHAREGLRCHTWPFGLPSTDDAAPARVCLSGP